MNTRKRKEKLREHLLNKRSRLPKEQWAELSRRVINRLRRLSYFPQKDIVHCYASMNERREVDTHSLIRTLLATGKQVVVPVMSEGVLTHHRLHSFRDLHPNEFGVPEPIKKAPVALAKLELVIVPMVGGDEARNRLGYGGGYYDRFLSKVEAPTIGLLFEKNVVAELPVEPFDVPLDLIVTEERVIGSL